MLKASVRCARHGTSEQRSQSLHRCHNRQSKHVLRRKLEPLRAFFVRGLCCNPCDPGRHKTGGPRPSPRLRPQAEAPFPAAPEAEDVWSAILALAFRAQRAGQANPSRRFRRPGPRPPGPGPPPWPRWPRWPRSPGPTSAGPQRRVAEQHRHSQHPVLFTKLH